MQELNIANNTIKELPAEYILTWGNYDVDLGTLSSQQKQKYKITVGGNPFCDTLNK